MTVSIALFGASGQLGTEVQRALAGREVLCFHHGDVDVRDEATVRARLRAASPHLVINCTAYNRVDDAEGNPPELMTNSLGVRNLAVVCAELGARLAHLSTDYVFDGNARRPCSERDPASPLGAYGRSKLVGEQAALSICPGALVIRTSGLYGLAGRAQKGGRGHFVEAMLASATSGLPIRVVTDQITSPTYCRDLAPKIVALIDADMTGVVHVTNSGQCSWFEFAQAIFELSELHPPLIGVTTDELNRDGRARAPRPRFSVLANDRLREPGLAPLRHWRDALAAYLRERKDVL